MAYVNFNSINSCKQAYIDYVLRGNSCGYDPCDIGKIAAKYADKLEYWKENPDTTEYEITDSEYNAAFLNGQEDAKRQTGYNGDRTLSNIKTGADGVLAIGNSALSCSSKKITEKISNKIAEKTAKDVAEETAKDVVKEAKFSIEDASWMITCGVTAINAAAYLAHKPNEEETNACAEMIEVQNEAAAELNQKSLEMEEANQESLELSDEANYITDESNNELENRKSEYDMARDTIEALKAKVDRGERLSEDEKSLWKECAALMQENSDSITTVQNDTNTKVSDINTEIAQKQVSFDNVADSMADLQGKTDFAASFDVATRAATTAEAIAQGVNALNGGIATAKGAKSAMASSAIFWVAAVKWIVVAIGAAATTACSLFAKKQLDNRSIAESEINQRKLTEDFNTKTNELYENNLEAYASNVETVENLELDIPEDIEAPEEMEAPQNTAESQDTSDNSLTNFGLSTNNQNDNDTRRRQV